VPEDGSRPGVRKVLETVLLSYQLKTTIADSYTLHFVTVVSILIPSIDPYIIRNIRIKDPLYSSMMIRYGVFHLQDELYKIQDTINTKQVI